MPKETCGNCGHGRHMDIFGTVLCGLFDEVEKEAGACARWIPLPWAPTPEQGKRMGLLLRDEGKGKEHA